MRVLGWVALAIAIVSVLIGISPILLVSGSEDGSGDAGWIFLLISVPAGVIGLVIAGILALVACVIGLRRDARVPGLIGVIGFVGSAVLAAFFFLALAGSGETALVLAVVVPAFLGYLVGLIAAIWAGFTADPRRTATA